MWLDTEILVRNQETAPDVYILRVDLQPAEEVAHAQNQGAPFTMVLRPPTRHARRRPQHLRRDRRHAGDELQLPSPRDHRRRGLPAADRLPLALPERALPLAAAAPVPGAEPCECPRSAAPEASPAP